MTAGKCGCGCGKTLTGGSASLYFADAECQARWHNQRATRPHEVYETPAWPPTGYRRLYGLEDDDDEPAATDTDTVDPGQYTYRRPCSRCGTRVVPVEGRRQETLTEQFARFGDDSGQDPARRWLRTLRCPQCGVELPGPPFTGRVTSDESTVTFELYDGRSRVRRSLNTCMLGRIANTAGLIQMTWRELERALIRYRDTFRGRPTGGC